MAALIDTHVILWWLRDEPRLSSTARKLLEDGGTKHWVSYASLWEIAIKMSLGKLDTGGRTIGDIVVELDRQGFNLLPMQIEHLSRLNGMEHHHGDPFDRILIAQAQELSVPLLTNDAKIKQYPVKTIW